jgi:hypothetical protein
LSIGATLFCCPGTGIASIIYSVQANTKAQAGDSTGASQAAKNAKIWLLVSVVLGVLGAYILLASTGSGS